MSEENDLDMSRAPLLAHLVELRRRLMGCLLFFTLVLGLCYWQAEAIYNFLMQPLVQVFGDLTERRMIYTGLHEAFLTHLKLSFFAALFFTLPLILIQLWRFIAPGLYRQEQRWVSILFSLTPALFFAGAALAYYVVFPLAWNFFLSFESGVGETAIPVQLEARVSEYLGLVIRLILAFGLAFELPVVLLLLAKVGILNARTLAENRRYAIVAVFAMAAVITPPDLISQVALGTPVLLLYEASICLIRLTEKREAREAQQLS
ncbi:twin-arginine translocase subunit TatC [Marinimicrobium locisalis]|uniref:twin-arginine translocase subunit TatC n=1 Tax=Marinimicrobium locisalis TaxID=546022 RepID=UPI003221CBB4